MNCAPISAPADRADGHDQAETQIDIAERAMTFRRNDRFADDVREIGADSKIPVQSDRAQRRPGNETAADAEKTAEDSDQKTNDREINRADLRVGDRKHHRNHSERPPCSRRIKPVVTHFEQDGLPDNQNDGNDGINVDVSFLEIVKPIGQEMQDGEEVTDDEGGIDDQLDQERRQCFPGFRFHCVCTRLRLCSLCRFCVLW